MDDWWEDQLFDYIYHDAGECQDEPWLNEMNYIGDEFKKAGMVWCLTGQHWNTSMHTYCGCNY